jgi:hypothetical protein
MRFETGIPIAAPPEAVRAWWTDIDPATVVRRDPDGTLHIRARFGAFLVTETFRVRPGGTWGFETRAPFGIDVRDDFEARPRDGGTLLRVTCEMRGRDALGKVALLFYGPIGRAQFRRQWRAMARACERDAARG